jgi:hypothetical protein
MTTPNCWVWPSIANLALDLVAVQEERAWWLPPHGAAPRDARGVDLLFEVHEKVDGTNVGMVASSGRLLGRHFEIEDAAATYQKAPLDRVRGALPDVRALERHLLQWIQAFGSGAPLPRAPPPQVRSPLLVVYGELVIDRRYGYDKRPDALAPGDWVVFGASLVDLEDPAAARDALHAAGFVVQAASSKAQQGDRVTLFMNARLAQAVREASAGRLRTPPQLVPPAGCLCDLVASLVPHLTGDAGLLLEGAVVTARGPHARVAGLVAKVKVGHADDSASRDKLQAWLSPPRAFGSGTEPPRAFGSGTEPPRAFGSGTEPPRAFGSGTEPPRAGAAKDAGPTRRALLAEHLLQVAAAGRAVTNRPKAATKRPNAPPEADTEERRRHLLAYQSAASKLDALEAYAASNGLRAYIAAVTDLLVEDGLAAPDAAAVAKAEVGRRMAALRKRG